MAMQDSAMQDLEQAIRERAYHLWIESGHEDGNADAHWLVAQREILSASAEKEPNVSTFGLSPQRTRICENKFWRENFETICSTG